MKENQPAASDELSTRERILAAAEQLFTLNGFESTSIRDITETASVNVAAINYHFGSKENLYTELISARMRALHSERIASLEQALAGKPTLETIIRAFVETHLLHLKKMATRDADLALIYREISSPGPAFEIVLRQVVWPTRELFLRAVKQVAPGLDDERVTLCLLSIMGQLVHFIKARRVVSELIGKEYDDATLKRIADHVVCFSLGGICKCGVG